jgi:hypothetical protein
MESIPPNLVLWSAGSFVDLSQVRKKRSSSYTFGPPVLQKY